MTAHNLKSITKDIDTNGSFDLADPGGVKARYRREGLKHSYIMLVISAVTVYIVEIFVIIEGSSRSQDSQQSSIGPVQAAGNRSCSCWIELSTRGNARPRTPLPAYMPLPQQTLPV